MKRQNNKLKCKWVSAFSKKNLLFKEVVKDYPMPLPKENIPIIKMEYKKDPIKWEKVSEI